MKEFLKVPHINIWTVQHDKGIPQTELTLDGISNQLKPPSMLHAPPITPAFNHSNGIMWRTHYETPNFVDLIF